MSNKGWFQLNSESDSAKDLLYRDIPQFFVWNKSTKKWKPREGKGDTIGRIYTSNPKDGERYYLRMLLNHVKGFFYFYLHIY